MFKANQREVAKLQTAGDRPNRQRSFGAFQLRERAAPSAAAGTVALQHRRALPRMISFKSTFLAPVDGPRGNGNRLTKTPRGAAHRGPLPRHSRRARAGRHAVAAAVRGACGGHDQHHGRHGLRAGDPAGPRADAGGVRVAGRGLLRGAADRGAAGRVAGGPDRGAAGARDLHGAGQRLRAAALARGGRGDGGGAADPGRHRLFAREPGDGGGGRHLVSAGMALHDDEHQAGGRADGRHHGGDHRRRGGAG